MRDRVLILAVLFAFLVLVTFPFWWDAFAKATSRGPEPVLPVKEKTCVAPAEYMKTSHMKLLIDWREQVVRYNNRTYTAYNGKSYKMSLTGTCMGCHTNKAEFCDRCHNYAGVNVYCWDCHIDPKLARKGVLYARR
jgi:[DsrC]-trisulfide reductase subunit J